ncbi:MAG: hypothetical protein M0023_01785 [Desulfobacteraceae bacterium]|nr:hypothetical protein [Desulfobacteraceae bacterium]
MAEPGFKPFKNESDTLQIGDLTIENRLDRVSIFGSLDITLDQEGVQVAKELKALLDLTVSEMEKNKLSGKIAVAKSETVINPFS